MTDFSVVTTWRPANRLRFETDDSLSPPRVVEAAIELVYPIAGLTSDGPDMFYEPGYFQVDHVHVMRGWQADEFEEAEISGVEFVEVSVEVAAWAQEAQAIRVPDLRLMRVLGTAYVDDVGIDRFGRCVMSRRACETLGARGEALEDSRHMEVTLTPADPSAERPSRTNGWKHRDPPSPHEVTHPADSLVSASDWTRALEHLVEDDWVMAGEVLLRGNTNLRAFVGNQAAPVPPTRGQRAFVTVWKMHLDIVNGGLIQFFGNCEYWQHRPIEDLAVIGLPEAAQQYAAILRERPRDDTPETSRFGRLFEPFPGGVAGDALCAYVRDNPHEFAALGRDNDEARDARTAP